MYSDHWTTVLHDCVQPPSQNTKKISGESCLHIDSQNNRSVDACGLFGRFHALVLRDMLSQGLSAVFELTKVLDEHKDMTDVCGACGIVVEHWQEDIELSVADARDKGFPKTIDSW